MALICVPPILDYSLKTLVPFKAAYRLGPTFDLDYSRKWSKTDTYFR